MTCPVQGSHLSVCDQGDYVDKYTLILILGGKRYIPIYQKFTTKTQRKPGPVSHHLLLLGDVVSQLSTLLIIAFSRVEISLPFCPLHSRKKCNLTLT